MLNTDEKSWKLLNHSFRTAAERRAEGISCLFGGGTPKPASQQSPRSTRQGGGGKLPLWTIAKGEDGTLGGDAASILQQFHRKPGISSERSNRADGRSEMSRSQTCTGFPICPRHHLFSSGICTVRNVTNRFGNSPSSLAFSSSLSHLVQPTNASPWTEESSAI